jgi:hypothetical protein
MNNYNQENDELFTIARMNIDEYDIEHLMEAHLFIFQSRVSPFSISTFITFNQPCALPA